MKRLPLNSTRTHNVHAIWILPSIIYGRHGRHMLGHSRSMPVYFVVMRFLFCFRCGVFLYPPLSRCTSQNDIAILTH